MQELDDNSLLKQYAEQHSDEAFAAIVSRHINKVYSAALRHTGNPGYAEEITQAVFVILAEKAPRLGRRVILSGWLYQTARLTSLTFLRSEIRRTLREQEAQMQNVVTESGDENWTQIAPLLDSAIASLNETDRHAVVLRFFDGKSMREVGDTLDATEDSARMRVNRALEKLRGFFARRGVQSTAAIIAGALSSHSLQAAPPALAVSVTAVALAHGAAASTSTLTLVKGALKVMAWHNMKTAIVAGAALIVATGAGVVAKEVLSGSPPTVPAAADGLPQTPEELNAWYVEPPAGQNAATIILQGVQAMQITADLNATLPQIFQPIPAPVKSALAAALPRNRDALQLFVQSTQYDQSRYPVDYTKDAALPYLQGVARGTRLEEWAAIWDAENGNGRQAADDVLAGVGLAHSLNAEPLMISQLVRAAGEDRAAAALEQVFNRTSVPPESLDKLANAFQAMDAYDEKGTGFTRALVGEKVLSTAMLNDRNRVAAYTNGLSADQLQQMTDYINTAPDFKQEQDFEETTLEKLLSAREEPTPARFKDAGGVFQRQAADAKSQGLLVNATLWNTLKATDLREARNLTNVRLAMTAVALEQFRAAHGNYPGSLDDLTPVYLAAMPLDLFNGRPLRYQKQGAGYLLYSLNDDLKDYGGRQLPGGKGNISFSVVNPPQ